VIAASAGAKTEPGKQRHGQRSGCHRQRTGHDQRSLCRRAVNRGADRRLRCNRRESTDAHHEPDRGLIPVMRQQQVDRQVGPEAVAHIGQKEVQ